MKTSKQFKNGMKSFFSPDFNSQEFINDLINTLEKSEEIIVGLEDEIEELEENLMELEDLEEYLFRDNKEEE